MRFLKLTYKDSSAEGTPLYLNLSSIESFQPTQEGSRIIMSSRSCYSVTEKVEDVLASLAKEDSKDLMDILGDVIGGK